MVYPCLVLAYFGEAAFLSKHKAELQHSFFKSIPGNISDFSLISFDETNLVEIRIFYIGEEVNRKYFNRDIIIARNFFKWINRVVCLE